MEELSTVQETFQRELEDGCVGQRAKGPVEWGVGGDVLALACESLP
jgi:hypothetical protein